MNNYFIIGKVNEGKSYLFNIFSKSHKTISNAQPNTTIDIIRKKISSINFEYNIYDTPGFYKLSEFELLLPRGAIFKFISKREQKFIPHRPTWKNLNNKRKISYYIYKLKLVGFKENIIPNADEYKMKELKINPETYKNLLFIGKNNN